MISCPRRGGTAVRPVSRLYVALFAAMASAADAGEIFFPNAEIAGGHDLVAGTTVDLYLVPPGKLYGDAIEGVRVTRVGLRGGKYGVYVDGPEDRPRATSGDAGPHWIVVPRVGPDGESIDDPSVADRAVAAADAVRNAAAVAEAAGAAREKLRGLLSEPSATPPEQVEITAGYVIDRAPDDVGWRTVVDEIDRNSWLYRGVTVMRLFVEEPDDAPIIAQPNSSMMFPFPQGPPLKPSRSAAYDILSDGQFTALRPYERFSGSTVAPLFVERHAFELLALRHETAVVPVEAAFGKIVAAGDVLLRKTPPDRRGDLVVRLADDAAVPAAGVEVCLGALRYAGSLDRPRPLDDRRLVAWRDVTAREIKVWLKIGGNYVGPQTVTIGPGVVTVATFGVTPRGQTFALAPPEVETHPRPE